MIIPVLTYQLLIVSFITAKRQLIHIRTAQRSSWNQSYDFIVVGAGTSGCVIANRLTEDPNVTVLMLEAGGAQDAIYTDIPAIRTLIDSERPDLEWVYYYEPDSFFGRRLRISMGRLLGGTSSIGAMAFFRPQQRDFDNWVESYGIKGWSFREVLPFFKRFENNTDWNVVNSSPGYHGTDGPVQITTNRNVAPIIRLNRRVYNELSYLDTDINGPNQMGTMIPQSYIGLNGFRTGAANAYIDPNPHPSNLHIVTRAQVTRILFNNTTAIGVEFNRFDTNYRVFARREVILSAGPHQTTQLLMLSGIGPRDNLQAFGIPLLLDLPVGRDTITAPRIRYLITNVSSNLINAQAELTLNTINQLYFNQSGPLTGSPLLYLYTSTKFNLDKKWPNIIIVSTTNENGQLYFYVILLRSISRGTASLQSSSPYIPLKFNANIFAVQSDLDNMVEAMRFLFRVMERTSLAQFMSPPTFESAGCPSCPGRYMYECDDGIRCLLLRQYSLEYMIRTCPMGAVDRNDVVVDPLLRVKNAHNLRICDTSIVNYSLGSNAQALMVGERCSQFIKECYNFQ